MGPEHLLLLRAPRPDAPACDHCGLHATHPHKAFLVLEPAAEPVMVSAWCCGRNCAGACSELYELVGRQQRAAMMRLVVPSETRAGVTYQLERLPDGMVSCTCPGYTNRGYCKHSRRYI